MPDHSQPNVLFVFPDQLGAAWTGCYGNACVQTPHLDAFARQGLLFENAFTASPLCTPARAALLTGRYPRQTGVVGNGQRLPPEEITLADLFNRGGYRTAYVGKWHLGGEPHTERRVRPSERGGFSDFTG